MMGVDGKLENPLLKGNIGLSSKLLKSSQISNGSMLSCQQSLSTGGLASKSSDSTKAILHRSDKLKSLKPKLFQSSLVLCEGLLCNSERTSDSILREKDKLKHSVKYGSKVGQSLKPSLFNHKLYQLSTSSSLNTSDVSYPAKYLQTATLSGLGNSKLKKSKSKPRTVESERDTAITSPAYELSFADTLKNVDPQQFFKEKKNYFVEKADDNVLLQKEKERLINKKVELINLVSIALLKSPNLETTFDTTRKQLMKQVKEMALLDPEFILKLALYTRRHLNVRIVANFLLAYSAYLQQTRPFLKKYYSQSIILPTDWVIVAEIYQTFFDKSINPRSLPTALRNVMVAKFPDFDEYQLGKYNKEKLKPKGDIVRVLGSDDEVDSGSEEGEPEIREFESYTLKKLIRKLHISEPVYHVMCILGKHYPDDSMTFYQARLPGIFNELKAGQRMKLATPETWETQVSLKGNKSTTWQDLLDHKKLPFMAMLRNLRNMLIAGINQKYHNLVLKRLSDEKSVINSKQFPSRFLAAYEVLEELEAYLQTGCYTIPNNTPSKKRGKPIVIPSNAFNKKLLTRYKNALDTALKISTIHNIPPISGTTVILIHYHPDFDNVPCGSAKSVSKKRTVIEMCLLLGLMCKFHCENGILLILDIEHDRFIEVEDVDSDKILDNMGIVLGKMKDIANGKRNIKSYLNDFLAERREIDNFLLIGGTTEPTFTDMFMKAYRKEVNTTCLCVSVLLMGNKSETELTGDYDVRVSGFTDQVLQYVAERGNGKQLTCIEKIDVAYGLEDILVKSKTRAQFVPKAEQIERPVMPWKTVRVFISSTFQDMHGERDLLSRYVFPELRCWCYNYCLNIYEVDLRWGITEKQSQSSRSLEMCLKEVMKADLFIGIIGQRYGWVPDTYHVFDSTGLDWLKKIKAGCSITELEMRGFKEKEESKFKTKSMFYFRDNSYLSNVPKEYVKDFSTEKGKEAKLENLKSFVQGSGGEIYNNYPCRWEGVICNKPILSGLEEFGQRVLNDLWNAIKVNYLSAEALCSVGENDEITADKHYEFAMELSKTFVGRKSLVEKVLTKLEEVKKKENNNLLLITGKSGSGKTAFMSKVIAMYVDQKMTSTCCYFVDASGITKSLTGLLQHLLENLNYSYNAGFAIPETYSELKLKMEDLFKSISKQLGGEQCIIFVDSLDKVNAGVNSSLTDWIPELLPKGICLVISCTENTACQRALLSHKQLFDAIKVGALELSDRANFVRKMLSNYGKELDESPFNNQMKLLLSKKDSESPLYLKLACEELRMFGVFKEFYQHIQQLAQTVPQIIEFSLKRIEMENGVDLVRDILSLLYFSRQGLSKVELFDSLNMLENFKNMSVENIAKVGFTCFHDSDFNQRKIPHVYFMETCLAIKLFLSEDNEKGNMKLTYSDILKVVQKRYISTGGSNYISKIHIVLAGLYRKQADPGNDSKWKGSDRKALIELPYHLTASGVCWKDLQSMLCSINFIKAKVEGNMCTHLLEDFQADAYVHSRQIQMESTKVLNHANIVETKEFISKNVHIFTKYPFLLMQQAVNAPNGSYIHKCSGEFTPEELKNVMVWSNKPSTLSKCSLTITQHQPLLCICLSRDETTIACGMADGQLILYDRNTTKELKSFVGHGRSITSCCFAGVDRLCSASDDGSVSIWNVIGGDRVHLLNKHKRQVSCCQSTEDGKLLISVSWDNTAKLWNIPDGTIAGELKGFIHPFNCIALDGRQKHAALGGWNRNIVIWNILENVKTAVYKGHTSSVRALTYAPSDRHLASSSITGEILLWSTENGAIVGQLSSRSSPLTSLSYTPSGLQLVAASTNTSIKVWTGSLGSPELTYIPNVNKDATDYALCVAVQKDFIAVGYNTGKVVIFCEKQTVLHEWKAHDSSVRSLSFIKCSNPTQTATHLVTGSDDSLVKRWAISSKVKCEIVMKGHTGPVRCVRSREAYIISGSEDCTLCVWPGLIFAKDIEDETKPSALLRSHASIVTCCDISPCESKAISGSNDKSFIIWDLNAKISLCTINQSHTDGLTACSWSDVGNYVVTGSNDFMLKLWDTKHLVENKNYPEKLKEKVTFVGHTGTINDAKYKHGCVVSACTDGSVKVWTHKGTEITTFNPHKKRINCCDIWASSLESMGSQWADVVLEKGIQQKVKSAKRSSMTDVLIYTASDDGTVFSYRPFKPCVINELYGHTDAVSNVLVSKRDSEVMTCSLDKTIKFWSYKAVCDNGNIASHAGEVLCITIFSTIAASGGYDGYIRIYHDLTTYSLQSYFACSTGAVKSIAFLSSDLLVTGDNVGNVCIWDILKEKVVASAVMESPVQCIAIGGENNDCIAVSCYTEFQIFRWITSSLTKYIETVHLTEGSHSQFSVSDKSQYILDYPMTSMLFLENSYQLVSTEHYNHFMYWDLKGYARKNHVKQIPKAEFMNKLIPKQTEMDSAASNIASYSQGSKLFIYIGNSNGTISFNQMSLLPTPTLEGEFGSKKIHEGPVTGMLLDKRGLMVTASKDCTIKVWKFSTTSKQLETMQQVGLFHCRAPVTSLAGIFHLTCITLMAGDASGNVDILEVKI